jgi:hypothetical protein
LFPEFGRLATVRSTLHSAAFIFLEAAPMKNFSPVSNHTLARGLVAYPKKPFAAMTDLPK